MLDQAFYHKLGFTELARTDEVLYLGLEFNEAVQW